MSLRVMLSLLLGLATLVYPIVVYLSIGHMPSHWLAALLLALAVARALIAQQKFWWVTAAGAAVLCAASMMRSDMLAIKLYPVLVNAVLLGVFAYSLWQTPSVVERLARLKEPDLPASGVRYTRRVTQVWCVFFVMNGAAAAYTAGWASDAQWALYNGAIAYGLMGCVMAVEWCVRQHVRKGFTPKVAP